MSDTIESLIVDLLEWIGPGSRPYDQTLDAWRTSCPRLPVWEEARDRGFVVTRMGDVGGRLVVVSKKGWEYVQTNRARMTGAG